MKIIKHYCDFCGKETRELKVINTPWWRVYMNIATFNFDYDYPLLKGDGCYSCFESYQRWLKSRKQSRG